MRFHTGKIIELQADYLGRPSAWVACPSGAVPAPGQYLKADLPGMAGEALPAILFATEISERGFQAAAPVPTGWMPGMELRLWGPLGNGFRLDWNLRHLALAAREDPSCLLPLVAQALARGFDVTLCTAGQVPALPASVEVVPLSALPEVQTWADLLALEVPLAGLPGLRSWLRIPPEGHVLCPTQVLIHTVMPCAGIADCGACAVSTRRGWKLACQDGPVFDLSLLEW